MTDATDDMEDQELRWSIKKVKDDRNNFSESVNERIYRVVEQIKEELYDDEIRSLIAILKEEYEEEHEEEY